MNFRMWLKYGLKGQTLRKFSGVTDKEFPHPAFKGRMGELLM